MQSKIYVDINYLSKGVDWFQVATNIFAILAAIATIGGLWFAIRTYTKWEKNRVAQVKTSLYEDISILNELVVIAVGALNAAYSSGYREELLKLDKNIIAIDKIERPDGQQRHKLKEFSMRKRQIVFQILGNTDVTSRSRISHQKVIFHLSELEKLGVDENAILELKSVVTTLSELSLYIAQGMASPLIDLLHITCFDDTKKSKQWRKDNDKNIRLLEITHFGTLLGDVELEGWHLDTINIFEGGIAEALEKLLSAIDLP